MPFIKAQKVIRDSDGNIVSGSAAVVDAVYIGTGQKNHSKQVVREKLGKVLFLSEDKKTGIFLSPTRGLVKYDSRKDTFNDVSYGDTRISGIDLFPTPEIHTVFGDSYLFLSFLKNSGLTDVLRVVFSKDEEYERVLCHLSHSVLKEGSRISCENFILKSFASYLFTEIPPMSLKSDTYYFRAMGSDSIKVSFFRSFVAMMQKKKPSFGKGCYVDSTPLPNDIVNNPFNALCCHGVSSSEVMIRLVLVLDEDTGLPVWYDIIPGNVLDINTVMKVVEDVAVTLNIEIDSLVLDAGYVSKELIQAFPAGTEKTMIGRMPARKGYPYKTLYWDVKDMIHKGKYEFIRDSNPYFGICRQISLFGQDVYAYVYVDHNNAWKRYSEYLKNHEEEYASLKDKDKDWLIVKNGYFVLISNKETTPKEMLSMYYCRTDIESVFKTAKEYLDLLPLSKWTDETVRGKLLNDIVSMIALLLFRKQINNSFLSVPEVLGKCQSLMCFRNNHDMVTVETPCKQVKLYYKLFGMDVPAHVKVSKFKKDLQLKM